MDIDIIKSSAKKPKIKKTKTKCTKEENQKTVKPTKSNITDQQNKSNIEDNLYSNTESNDNLTEINVEAWNCMGVPNVVIKALADQNFHSPTIIQARTLPAALLGRRDILGAAETGSGKTLAFGIPIIKGILELKSQQSEVMVSKKSVKKYDENTKSISSEEELEGKNITSV